MQVLVRDNDALKKKMQREGIFREITPIIREASLLNWSSVCVDPRPN